MAPILTKVKHLADDFAKIIEPEQMEMLPGMYQRHAQVAYDSLGKTKTSMQDRINSGGSDISPIITRDAQKLVDDGTKLHTVCKGGIKLYVNQRNYVHCSA